MKRAKFTLALIAATCLVAVGVLKAAPTLSVEAAREHLKKGALILDVRTVGEFQSRHLTNAINIPVDELKATLPQRVSDKSQILLLHCRSGRRSGTAERELRALGYTNAFNIGSFERASEIVNGKPSNTTK